MPGQGVHDSFDVFRGVVGAGDEKGLSFAAKGERSGTNGGIQTVEDFPGEGIIGMGLEAQLPGVGFGLPNQFGDTGGMPGLQGAVRGNLVQKILVFYGGQYGEKTVFDPQAEYVDQKNPGGDPTVRQFMADNDVSDTLLEQGLGDQGFVHRAGGCRGHVPNGLVIDADLLNKIFPGPCQGSFPVRKRIAFRTPLLFLTIL